MSEVTTPLPSEADCLLCGARFIPKRRINVYCSRSCQERAALLRKREQAQPVSARPCQGCGGEYTPPHWNSRYCSKSCHGKAKWGRVRDRTMRPAGEEIACLTCSAVFTAAKYWQKYCSVRCREVATQARVVARKTEKLCRTCLTVKPRAEFGDRSWNCLACEALDAEGLKRCGRCRHVKPFDDFNRMTRRSGPSDRQSTCRACSRLEQARRTNDPIEQRRARDNRLRRQFGITADQFELILAAQGGVCAVCGEEPGDRAFHVDHDHACCPGGTKVQTCGQCIRGITCPQCNAGLGHFKDSVERLEAAVKYLTTSGFGIRT